MIGLDAWKVGDLCRRAQGTRVVPIDLGLPRDPVDAQVALCEVIAQLYDELKSANKLIRVYREEEARG